MLLDVSRLRGVEVDAGGMAASVEPGCRGDELLAELAEHDLFSVPMSSHACALHR
jgi:FAD/FMN-containing dehydrogenase